MSQENQLVEQIMGRFIQEQVNSSRFIDLMFENISFLSERKHLDNPKIVSLMVEFVGPFKQDKTFSSNEEKELKVAMSNVSKAMSALKSVDLKDNEKLKSQLSNVVTALLDLKEKEEQLDPVEISPEMKNGIDVLFGMAAYNLTLAKSTIDANLENIQKALPGFRLKAAVQKAKQQSSTEDMASMTKKINIPLWKRLGGLAAAGLDSGGGPKGSGVKVR